MLMGVTLLSTTFREAQNLNNLCMRCVYVTLKLQCQEIAWLNLHIPGG